MLLTDLPLNTACQIISMSKIPSAARKKLFAMGLLPNTQISVVRVAPLGDPLQVRVRGYDLALNKALAMQIDVLPLGDDQDAK